MICGRDEAAFADRARDLSARGTCAALPADVSTEAGCRALADAYAQHEDGLDVLVNNAGGASMRPFEDFDEEAWESVLAVNLKGVSHLTRFLLPMLRATARDDAPVARDQHRLDLRRAGRRARQLRLHVVEGGAAPLHQASRTPARAGDHRERDRARAVRVADDGADPGAPRRRDRQDRPAATHRRARATSRRRHLPRIARGRVGHGHRAHRRRRGLTDMTDELPHATITEDDGIITVTTDRQGKLNAISPQVTEAYWEAVTRLEDRDDLRCMVITATGKYFTAGLDLRGPAATGPAIPRPSTCTRAGTSAGTTAATTSSTTSSRRSRSRSCSR